MALTNEELKAVIIDLRMDIVKKNIPRGHCPYAYYHIDNPTKDCNEVDCDECHRIFNANMRKIIESEVAQL